MKNISKSESVFKKKGFYAALYSCAGIVLLLVAAISYFGIGEREPAADTGQISEGAKQDVAAVINPSTKTQIPESSYLTPADRAAAQDTAKRNAPAKQPPAAPGTGTKAPDAPSGSGSQPEAAPTGVNSTQIEEIKAPAADAKDGAPDKASPVSVEVTTQRAPEFTAFTDGSVMEWPAFGDIVMDYSPEHVIYDVTLEHFQTNDSISIAAQAGSQVKASAEGVVKSVYSTDEGGNTVVIDHGNGWETQYSQLQDVVLVSVGDVVDSGQIIGGVANPTKYGVLLGSHLDFKVSKEEQTVDPKIVLTD